MLSVYGTYDTRATSWYESMAIMPRGDDASRPPAAPTRSRTNTAVKGVLTHGHLPENDHHGGAPGTLPDATQAPRRPALDPGRHQRASLYGQGDLSLPGALGRPPVVAPASR